VIGIRDLLAGLASVGFGALSAVVPIANAEAYVVTTEAVGVGHAALVGVSVGIGQSFGKSALFLAVRHGKRLPRFARHEATSSPRWPRLRAFSDRLMILIGSRWGLPITMLAAVVGIPPLYPLAMIAGATKMPLLLFFLTVLVGRCARFVLLAFGIDAGIAGLVRLER
jgi:membrane protein YqaA with SNARE-associated domain